LSEFLDFVVLPGLEVADFLSLGNSPVDHSYIGCSCRQRVAESVQ
jgi:hypothetical protein